MLVHIVFIILCFAFWVAIQFDLDIKPSTGSFCCVILFFTFAFDAYHSIPDRYIQACVIALYIMLGIGFIWGGIQAKLSGD